jgi:hypothetical protein
MGSFSMKESISRDSKSSFTAVCVLAKLCLHLRPVVGVCGPGFIDPAEAKTDPVRESASQRFD